MQESQFTPDEYTFRVVGQLVLVAAAVVLIFFVANLRAQFYYGALNLSGLGYIAGYGIIVGYGLMQIKKWAAVLLAAPLLIFGCFIATKAVIAQPTLWTIFLAFFWAALLSLPSALIVRRWRILR